MTSKHHKSKKQEPARPERLLPKANAKIRVNILYDDGHVLALDKPVGLPTQPGRGHIDDTLVNAAFATHGEALSKLGADRDWGLLHRLDLDVGGVVGFAPADIVDESQDALWVTGLPDEAQLVAEGQDHVAAGMRVTPVVREEAAADGG